MTDQQSSISNETSSGNSHLSGVLDDRDKALESKDGKSRIKKASSRVEDEAKEKGMAAIGHAKSDEDVGNITRPVLIVGFPGTGLVGSVSANYIIEKYAPNSFC